MFLLIYIKYKERSGRINNIRELTRAELRDIKKLVVDRCANYDRDYGCLPLDGQCYMFYGVGYTNTGMCKYFRNAVLPLNPQLEAVLNGNYIADNVKKCCICGTGLYAVGNRAKYCESCACRVHRKQKNVSDRKRRFGADK